MLGPLLWGPLSEIFGRRPIFIITFIAYIGFQVGCALSKNTASILVFRFLGGTFAAAPLTNSGALIADIWDGDHRGKAMCKFLIFFRFFIFFRFSLFSSTYPAPPSSSSLTVISLLCFSALCRPGLRTNRSWIHLCLGHGTSQKRSEMMKLIIRAGDGFSG
jgi:MFS family permease